MKIEGPNKTGSTSKSKKSGGTSGVGGSFSDFIASAPKEAAATTTTRSIAHVDSLLSIQGAEDPAQGASRKRMRQRATDILSELDKIKIGMLNGNLTVGHMVDIADVVASHREKITDPKLTAIMDEIDLRAQVELAKMQVALEARQKRV